MTNAPETTPAPATPAAEAPTVEALIAVGGKLWNPPNGGSPRVYFNDLAALAGLKTTHYNSGNVSSATLDGEKISNSTARGYLVMLQDAKVWFDVGTGKWNAKGIDVGWLRDIVDAIKAKLAKQG